MWKLTDSEWKVLEALWAGGPQHLGQILGALAPETGWSRTTVHTYLTRMAAKGLVSMDQSSPRRYAAIPSRETCAARERRAVGGRGVVGAGGPRGGPTSDCTFAPPPRTPTFKDF